MELDYGRGATRILALLSWWLRQAREEQTNAGAALISARQTIAPHGESGRQSKLCFPCSGRRIAPGLRSSFGLSIEAVAPPACSLWVGGAVVLCQVD